MLAKSSALNVEMGKKIVSLTRVHGIVARIKHSSPLHHHIIVK